MSLTLKTLRTASGKELDITGGAPSTIDGVLRFWVVNSTLHELNALFDGRPEEAQTLTIINDGIESVFAGYTDYLGAQRQPHEHEIMISFYAEG